jgi:PAS domain S-box-containing protein
LPSWRAFYLDAAGISLCRIAFSDISQRRQAEADLKESEKRYRSLFQLNHAVMLLIDPATGDIVDANPAACAYYGWTYEELVARNITDINLLPRDQVFKEMQRAVSLQCRQFFFRHRLAGGEVRHVEVYSGPIRLQGQNLLYSIINDITARRQAEEALQRAHDELGERVRERTEDLRNTVEQLEREIEERRQTEEALARQVTLVQDLYNNAPCGYHSLDPEGTFVQINDTELAWLGYAREEVLGRMKFSDIVTADSLKLHQQTFPEFKARGWVRDVEYELIRRDGTVMPVSLSATAIRDEAGHFLMSRSTVFDMTERKRTEEAIKQSELRLRHLTSQLLTAQEEDRHRISLALHDDLGQSLMVLKLQLRGVEKNLPPGPGAAKSREECTVALDYLDTTIQNIRRISKNLRPAILENFGLGSALKSLVNEFCQRQELKCSYEVDDLAQSFPTETEIVIYRIFQETLTNIGKHAQATRVEIVVKKRQDHVHLSINDNGTGFDMKEVLAGTSNTGGMGLGSMEERVRMLGGTLQLGSEMGKGTRISFNVPLIINKPDGAATP